MTSIKPKNLTAQLHYRGAGNPPQSHPIAAVGNFFPGLEFNFLNVWKRLFIGIELLETGGEVLRVDAGQPADLKPGSFLLEVDGKAMFTIVRGPTTPGGPDENLGPIFLEWTNALSDVHAKKGGTADTAACVFNVPVQETQPDGSQATVFKRKGPFNFKVRRLIEADTALISREANLPGELTESLCSPWQSDYIGCACYYWAANRPDYVNVQKAGNVSVGHNWLNLSRVRTADGNPLYTLRPENNLRHEDVLQGWEHKFHFIIGGKDAVDGAVPTEEEKPTS